jgi:restriction system protein
MAIPTYGQFIEPVLRFLAANPNGVRAKEAHEAAAAALHLTDEERQQLLPNVAQLVYKNRAGWAHDRLKRAGLSSSPTRGYWKLTERGAAYVAAHKERLNQEEVQKIAFEFLHVRLRPGAEHADDIVNELQQIDQLDKAKSPDERLSDAVTEIRSTVVNELGESLKSVSPSFFESIVLDVLHKMGYGASRTDLQRVGGSGDGGIDGIISLDKLGLEKVYVQAKRWQQSVGSPEIQAFYGALAGQRATKGVFITTSSYTRAAIDFARQVERVVLIDGAKLAELMIDCEVGVTSRLVKVPRLDGDYFDEE